jgi:hypothetical protein
MNQQPDDFEDDGRVVCDMNVAGMPWHQDRCARTTTDSGQERRVRYTWYALLAGLALVAVFSIVWILFTLFATQVWFR